MVCKVEFWHMGPVAKPKVTCICLGRCMLENMVQVTGCVGIMRSKSHWSYLFNKGVHTWNNGNTNVQTHGPQLQSPNETEFLARGCSKEAGVGSEIIQGLDEPSPSINKLRLSILNQKSQPHLNAKCTPHSQLTLSNSRHEPPRRKSFPAVVAPKCKSKLPKQPSPYTLSESLTNFMKLTL